MSQDRRGVETKHKSTFKPGSGGCAERWRCAAGKVVSAGRWRGREEEEEEEEERFVLKACKSYSKPSWGGTFIRLPARFILCLQHVASMLPVWC